MALLSAYLSPSRPDQTTSFVAGLVWDATADLEGHAALHYAAARGDTAAVCALLAAGAPAAARSERDAAPLHLAAFAGSARCVDLLLRAEGGAAADAADGFGDTALHEAARAGAVEACLVLLRADRALAEARNLLGLTPLDVASTPGVALVIKQALAGRELRHPVLEPETRALREEVRKRRQLLLEGGSGGEQQRNGDEGDVSGVASEAGSQVQDADSVQNSAECHALASKAPTDAGDARREDEGGGGAVDASASASDAGGEEQQQANVANGASHDDGKEMRELRARLAAAEERAEAAEGRVLTTESEMRTRLRTAESRVASAVERAAEAEARATAAEEAADEIAEIAEARVERAQSVADEAAAEAAHRAVVANTDSGDEESAAAFADALAAEIEAEEAEHQQLVLRNEERDLHASAIERLRSERDAATAAAGATRNELVTLRTRLTELESSEQSEHVSLVMGRLGKLMALTKQAVDVAEEQTERAAVMQVRATRAAAELRLRGKQDTQWEERRESLEAVASEAAVRAEAHDRARARVADLEERVSSLEGELAEKGRALSSTLKQLRAVSKGSSNSGFDTEELATLKRLIDGAEKARGGAEQREAEASAALGELREALDASTVEAQRARAEAESLREQLQQVLGKKSGAEAAAADVDTALDDAETTASRAAVRALARELEFFRLQGGGLTAGEGDGSAADPDELAMMSTPDRSRAHARAAAARTLLARERLEAAQELREAAVVAGAASPDVRKAAADEEMDALAWRLVAIGEELKASQAAAAAAQANAAAAQARTAEAEASASAAEARAQTAADAADAAAADAASARAAEAAAREEVALARAAEAGARDEVRAVKEEARATSAALATQREEAAEAGEGASVALERLQGELRAAVERCALAEDRATDAEIRERAASKLAAAAEEARASAVAAATAAVAGAAGASHEAEAARLAATAGDDNLTALAGAVESHARALLSAASGGEISAADEAVAAGPLAALIAAREAHVTLRAERDALLEKANEAVDALQALSLERDELARSLEQARSAPPTPEAAAAAGFVAEETVREYVTEVTSELKAWSEMAMAMSEKKPAPTRPRTSAGADAALAETRKDLAARISEVERASTPQANGESGEQHRQRVGSFAFPAPPPANDISPTPLEAPTQSTVSATAAVAQ